MVFTIQKKYLLSLGSWLNTLSLTGKQSRARTRFVALLQDSLERLEKERKQMVEEVCEKEEDGTPKMVDDDNGNRNYVVPDALKEEFNKDIAELYDENAELSGPETGPVFLIVKDIVLNTDEKIEPALAVQYDAWCKAFEAFPTVAGME